MLNRGDKIGREQVHHVSTKFEPVPSPLVLPEPCSDCVYFKHLSKELQQENEILKTEANDAQKRADSTANKLGKAKAMIEELKDLKTDVLNLKQKSTQGEESQQNEIVRLRRENEIMESRLGEQHAKHEVKMTELLKEIARHRNLETTFQEEVTQGIKIISEQTKQIADLSHQVNLLSERAKDDKRLVDNLEGINLRLKQDFEKVQKKLSESQSQARSLERLTTQRQAISIMDEGEKEKESVQNYVPMRNRSSSPNVASSIQTAKQINSQSAMPTQKRESIQNLIKSQQASLTKVPPAHQVLNQTSAEN